MSTKITNPFLKQLISEIAQKSTAGRMTDINWAALNEGKKKKTRKTEANMAPKKPDAEAEEPATDAAPEEKPAPKSKAPSAPKSAEKLDAEPAPDLPSDDGKEDPLAGLDTGPEDAAPEASAEDAEEAKADATKAKAELEKAKADTDRAEKEIKQHSYVKLSSSAGTQYLIGKILDHAFKTNTIDALAGEMVQKLKIQTPEDMNSFNEDMAAFRVIPGMPELLASMKTLATKQPEADDEPTA